MGEAVSPSLEAKEITVGQKQEEHWADSKAILKVIQAALSLNLTFQKTMVS